MERTSQQNGERTCSMLDALLTPPHTQTHKRRDPPSHSPHPLFRFWRPTSDDVGSANGQRSRHSSRHHMRHRWACPCPCAAWVRHTRDVSLAWTSRALSAVAEAAHRPQRGTQPIVLALTDLRHRDRSWPTRAADLSLACTVDDVALPRAPQLTPSRPRLTSSLSSRSNSRLALSCCC